jgi:hypothetical protein
MSGLPTGLCRLLATARPRRPSGAALMASRVWLKKHRSSIRSSELDLMCRSMVRSNAANSQTACGISARNAHSRESRKRRRFR